MQIDSLGLPKDNGATDLQDSARLAGISTAFGYITFECDKYVVDGKYVRHPLEVKYDFSRDQAICLMAGLAAINRQDLIDPKYITGKDILSPSVKGYIRTLKGQSPNILQNLWLTFDIMWAAYVKPDAELNQLLCMLIVAPPKYLRLFTKHHKTWDQNVTEYWSGWRDERGLGQHIIETVMLKSRIA